MRDVFLFLIFLFYIVLGFRAVFFWGLGYIWTDYFTPNQVAFGWFANIPSSFLLAVLSFVGWIISPNKHLPRHSAGIWLLLVLAVWVTLTTTWALVPDWAWIKWDWAFKTIIFSAFIPFLFRTRLHLDALILTILFAFSGSILAAATKTLHGGGGYGVFLGLTVENSGRGEGSTFAGVSVAFVPLMLWAKDHSFVLGGMNTRLRSLLFNGLAAAAIITSIGTYSRTGLVALLVLGVVIWLGTRRKALVALLMAFMIGIAAISVGSNWLERMNTVAQYNSDESAESRIAVWLWTIKFAMVHPLGGGFEVSRLDRVEVVRSGKDQPLYATGIAFHSVYFEMLGEQGFVGLAILLGVIVILLRNCAAIRSETRTDHDLDWLHSLAGRLAQSQIVYLAAGAFIGIAFQPLLFQMLAVSVIARNLTLFGSARPALAGQKPAALQIESQAAT